MKFYLHLPAVLFILGAAALSSCGKKPESSAATPARDEGATVKEAKAQDSPPAATTPPEHASPISETNFFGTIGGQPVVMQLKLDPAATGRSAVTGSYFIEAQGAASTVEVKGTMEDGRLTMEQSGAPGTFELTRDSLNRRLYLGAWKSPGRVLPVKLNAAP